MSRPRCTATRPVSIISARSPSSGWSWRGGRWRRCCSCDPREVVFTGGGTEADNLAVLGACGRGGHVITTTIEHPAVLSACAQLRARGRGGDARAGGPDGVVDPDDIRRALRPDTVLISVMHANNELGTLQPIAEIARIAREAGVLFHSDGVQALGKTAGGCRRRWAWTCTRSAGTRSTRPRASGALYVRKGAKLAPILFGGHHERDRAAGHGERRGRGGLGRGGGVDAASISEAESARLAALRDRLEQRHSGARARCARERRGARRATPNTTQHPLRRHRGRGAGDRARPARASRYRAARRARAARSSLRTCCWRSGSTPDAGAVVSIRFSLGRSNTAEQVDALVEAVAESVAHLRRIAPVTRPMPEHPIAVAMSGGVDSSTVAGHAGARRAARHRADHAALEPAAAAGDRGAKAPPGAAARSTTSTMRAASPSRSASRTTW